MGGVGCQRCIPHLLVKAMLTCTVSDLSLPLRATFAVHMGIFWMGSQYPIKFSFLVLVPIWKYTQFYVHGYMLALVSINIFLKFVCIKPNWVHKICPTSICKLAADFNFCIEFQLHLVSFFSFFFLFFRKWLFDRWKCHSISEKACWLKALYFFLEC